VVSANSWETLKPASLREIWDNIQELEQEKRLLEYKWKSFIIWWNSLSDYVRDDISDEEKSELEFIVELHIQNTDTFRIELEELVQNWTSEDEISSKKTEWIQLKKEFYTSLLSYIQDEKIESYKSYIESDLLLNEKSKDVSTEIQIKTVKKQERVEYLQEKINNNKELLRSKIESRVWTMVRERLDTFIERETFRSLSLEDKTLIFQKLITKIDEKISELEFQTDITSVIEEKIILFRVVQDILWEYIDNFEQ